MSETFPGARANLDEMFGRSKVEAPKRDSRYEKWCQWLKAIDRELTDLYLNRSVWRGVTEIVRAKADMPPSHFFDLQALNYSTAQAVAVRRQAEVSDRVVTLGRLLKDIGEFPEVLSRQRYVAMWPWGMQHLGDEFFDEWAGEGGDHVGPARVLSDFDGLYRKCETVKRYVDTRIAHAEPRRPSDVAITFDDLDSAIDALGELFQRYTALLTAVDRTVIEPVPQYDWCAPFRVAWLPG